jgi:Double-GTPase 2
VQGCAAIVAVIIVVYLYLLLIRFLFGVVGPELLVVGSALGTGVVPAVYGMVVYRMLNRMTWRRALWVPVFFLLALIYVDLAYIVVRVIAGIVPAHATPVLLDLTRPVVALHWNRPGVTEWRHLFGIWPAWWGAILIGTAVKGIAIVGMLLAIRGFDNEVQDARQPAFRQYFFGQALRDLRAVAEQTATQFYQLVEYAARGLYALSAGPQAWFVWPLTVTAYAALIAPTIAAGVSLAILLSVHAIGICVAWVLTMYVSLMLFCIERAVMLARSGYAKCPHAGCHEPVPLPVFYCPECGAVHDRLIPGRCGAFRRACACGNASLPTTYWLGKAKLRSACPRCKKPLRSELFGGSAHVPIYGAASSGKTMLMMSVTWELVQGDLASVSVDFINESDRASYETVWKPGFETGRVREKTRQMLPDAFLLSVRRAGGLPLSLYMYDPAGEAIESESDIGGHRFLRYVDGMALLIDPFSLPAMARAYEAAGNSILPPSTSHADPVEVINRIVAELENQAQLVRTRGFQRRIAVVITKADNEFVRREFGLTLDGAVPAERWRDAGLADDELVRGWLRHNEPGLLQLLETRFSMLRFFAVSALGHDPSERCAFQPQNVLNPLAWLLAGRTTLTRPALARLWGRGAEIGAALVVLAVFVTPVFVAARLAWHAVAVAR